MSRSYKRTPRCGDKKSKYGKRLANHIVRRVTSQDAFPHYGGYKKMFESWNICDYEQVGVTFESFYRNEGAWSGSYREPPDRVECEQRYKKYYLRK